MRNIQIILSLLLLIPTMVLGQTELQIGQWREHLPYTEVIAVAEDDELIYAATPYALFTFNKSTKELERLSKINGLSGSDISYVAYFEDYKYAILGYENGNLDIITDDAIINLPDIKNSSLVANKTINRILQFDDQLYVLTGFGVVVLNPYTLEFQDKYTMPNNGTFLAVFDLERDSTHWYAGTETGLYKALREGVNLTDFAEWKQQWGMENPWAKNADLAVINDTVYSSCIFKWDPDTIYYSTPDKGWVRVDGPHYWNHNFFTETADYLIVGAEDTVIVYDHNWQVVDSILSKNYGGNVDPRNTLVGKDDGLLYIADATHGLVTKDLDKGFWSRYAPEGPSTNEIYEITARDGHVYFSHGSRTRTNGNNKYKSFTPNHYFEGKWHVISTSSADFDAGDIRDIVALKMNPNDPEHLFMASLNRGVVEVYQDKLMEIYDDTNSTLTRFIFDSTFTLMSVADVHYDYQGNLWAAVSNVQEALSVYTTDGDWYTFSPEGLHSGRRVDHLLIDQFGNKWLSQTESSGGGIIVFNDQGTLNDNSDDRNVSLSTAAGNGNLPSNGITAMVEDLDGEIWIGTTQGIGVIFAPSQIFNGAQAQQLLIQQDGYTEYLLEGQEISCIAVDGANRKWIGTTTSGLFLISEDGSEEVAHFTAENSGLFSDAITSVAVDHSTGEVWIGTGNGLVSYMAAATAGGYTLDNVRVFPNPVPPGFNGNIVVDGLMLDTEVTITDASGNYVNQMNSLGGRMVWDGKDINGERVSTGVYLLMGISADGSKRVVSKVAVIH